MGKYKAITLYPIDGEPYQTDVKFFSELQDIAEESIGIRYLNVLTNNGEEVLLVAEAIPSNYSREFIEKHSNRNFMSTPILGPVIRISVEGLETIEYEKPV